MSRPVKQPEQQAGQAGLRSYRQLSFSFLLERSEEFLRLHIENPCNSKPGQAGRYMCAPLDILNSLAANSADPGKVLLGHQRFESISEELALH